MTLNPGFYFLAEDIRNPNVDRRMRYDWRFKEVLKSGMRFEVSRQMPDKSILDSLPAAVDKSKLARIAIQPLDRGSKVYDDHVLFPLLVEALVQASPTLENFLRNNTAQEILQKLLDAGKVSLDDIEVVLETP